MENDHIRTILNNIENGTLTASEAYAQLKLGILLRISDTPRSIITAKCVRERRK